MIFRWMFVGTVVVIISIVTMDVIGGWIIEFANTVLTPVTK